MHNIRLNYPEQSGGELGGFYQSGDEDMHLASSPTVLRAYQQTNLVDP